MSKTLIKMENITKKFITDDIETYALSNINLIVKEGEFISISGPSGCGKSTLLSIMGLLDTSSEGNYFLDGKNVSDLTSSDQTGIRNQKIGFIFQSFNLISDMTVYENVELPLVYRGIEKKERKERVQHMLDKVKMSHRNNHLPSQLSGGQQQRIAIARSLAGKPSFLLADEPTGNLDSTNGEQAMDLLQSIHDEGATICMVTHDKRYNSVATRIVNVFDGRIVSENDPSVEESTS